MDAKSFIQSKTIWVNALATVAAALLSLTGIVPPSPEVFYPVALGLINVFLRFVTKQPIELKKKSDESGLIAINPLLLLVIMSILFILFFTFCSRQPEPVAGTAYAAPAAVDRNDYDDDYRADSEVEIIRPARSQIGPDEADRSGPDDVAPEPIASGYRADVPALPRVYAKDE